jgi:hypothetical protein
MSPTTTAPELDVIALARAVAGLLPGWKLGETSQTRDPGSRPQWAHIEHTSGAQLSLSFKAWPKPERIHVSGVWPRRQPNGAYGEFMPKDAAPFSINVGLSKSPAQIVRDVTRRMLDGYMAEYAVQAGRLAATLAGEDVAAAAAARIAASIDAKANKGQGDSHTIWLHDLFGERRGHGDLKVSPGETGEPPYVNLELHGITPDEAIQILMVLRGDLRGTAVLATLDKQAPR